VIEPGELYKHFKVRDTVTGREVWLNGNDARYPGDGCQERPWDHRRDDTGGWFALVFSTLDAWMPGYLVRLEEIEPLPDGRGLYGPGAGPCPASMERSYEGSWRQYADQQAKAGAR
jgi:hypothetical protein